MILLLDSSVLIDVLNARKGRPALLLGLVSSGHRLATSAVNIAEVYSGMRNHEERKTHDLMSQLAAYDTTRTIGRRAGTLRSDAAKRGITLALADVIVAATALEYDLTLMTDNRKDFPIPDLKFFDLP